MQCLAHGIFKIAVFCSLTTYFLSPWQPSACMDCSGKIANGEPRVGYRQEAWQFEGIMTRWLHLTCALAGAQNGIQRISQLEGWDRMGYDASKEIREVSQNSNQRTDVTQQLGPSFFFSFFLNVGAVFLLRAKRQTYCAVGT